MPAAEWRGDRSLEEWLYTEPHSFDFLQAVHLLELWQAHGTSTGTLPSPPVRFRASFELGNDGRLLRHRWNRRSAANVVQ